MKITERQEELAMVLARAAGAQNAQRTAPLYLRQATWIERRFRAQPELIETLIDQCRPVP